ncbi:MAG: tetratricopeptide repeat protein [Nanoarchaeota archaeon]|nr:tetratricopeptide repeat protein [Nanoarchaeota archaeon]
MKKREQSIDLNKESVKLVIEGRYKEALEFLNKAIKLTPHIPQHWNNKGIVLEKLGRNKEALKCFKTAEKINRKTVFHWQDLGREYLHNGEENLAIDAFDNALKVDKYYTGKRDYDYNNKIMNLLFYKAMALGELKRFEEAINCMDDALKINPGNKIILSTKESILKDLKKTKK